MADNKKINKWINKPVTREVTLFLFFFMWFAAAFVLFSSADAGNQAEPFAERQRPPVNFLDELHDMHMDSYECLDCHHNFENGENVLDESELEEGNPDIQCAACHHSAAETDLMDAFHIQCIGCHDQLNSDDGGSLPILCGECHVRQETTGRIEED